MRTPLPISSPPPAPQPHDSFSPPPASPTNLPASTVGLAAAALGLAGAGTAASTVAETTGDDSGRSSPFADVDTPHVEDDAWGLELETVAEPETEPERPPTPPPPPPEAEAEPTLSTKPEAKTAVELSPPALQEDEPSRIAVAESVATAEQPAEADALEPEDNDTDSWDLGGSELPHIEHEYEPETKTEAEATLDVAREVSQSHITAATASSSEEDSPFEFEPEKLRDEEGVLYEGHYEAEEAAGAESSLPSPSPSPATEQAHDDASSKAYDAEPTSRDLNNGVEAQLDEPSVPTMEQGMSVFGDATDPAADFFDSFRSQQDQAVVSSQDTLLSTESAEETGSTGDPFAASEPSVFDSLDFSAPTTMTPFGIESVHVDDDADRPPFESSMQRYDAEVSTHADGLDTPSLRDAEEGYPHEAFTDGQSVAEPHVNLSTPALEALEGQDNMYDLRPAEEVPELRSVTPRVEVQSDSLFETDARMDEPQPPSTVDAEEGARFDDGFDAEDEIASGGQIDLEPAQHFGLTDSTHEARDEVNEEIELNDAVSGGEVPKAPSSPPILQEGAADVPFDTDADNEELPEDVLHERDDGFTAETIGPIPATVSTFEQPLESTHEERRSPSTEVDTPELDEQLESGWGLEDELEAVEHQEEQSVGVEATREREREHEEPLAAPVRDDPPASPPRSSSPHVALPVVLSSSLPERAASPATAESFEHDASLEQTTPLHQDETYSPSPESPLQYGTEQPVEALPATTETVDDHRTAQQEALPDHDADAEPEEPFHPESDIVYEPPSSTLDDSEPVKSEAVLEPLLEAEAPFADQVSFLRCVPRALCG